MKVKCSKNSGDLRGTWRQALVTFFTPIFLILVFRWLFIEPFVIPSGSMIPNLLIHDHIAVNKMAYGIHWPFSDRWIFRWGGPEYGDIVVFRFPENPEIFYIKRLIGKPGDQVVIKDQQMKVNNLAWNLTPAVGPSETSGEGFKYYFESSGKESHVVRFLKPEKTSLISDEEEFPLEGRQANDHFEITVPPGEYFFMGDNRDQSSDGRVWGTVPDHYLIGRAWLVWLSCEDMLESANFACNPALLRWKRILKLIK